MNRILLHPIILLVRRKEWDRVDLKQITPHISTHPNEILLLTLSFVINPPQGKKHLQKTKNKRTHLPNLPPPLQKALPTLQETRRGRALHSPQRAPQRPPHVLLELCDRGRRRAVEEDLVGEAGELGG